jgi:hypothetical protein
MVLEAIVSTVKENKRDTDQKGKRKLSIFGDDSVKTPKELKS